LREATTKSDNIASEAERMKLDPDLARQILLKVEELPFDGSFHDVEIEGHAENEVSYHVMLLDEAGLLEAGECSHLLGVSWKPQRLTYEGHQFLDAARSDTVWQKAKVRMMKATGTLTLEGLKMVLPHVVKALIQGTAF
jgi:hypothetical protein